MDSIPPLLGLALRAGRLAAGEEPVEAVCRAHKAYLMLLAKDAADNTIRRANQFCQAGKTICLTLPFSKEALGACLGRASCAIVVISEIGFAAAVAEKLAKADPETYGDAWDTLSQRAARFKKRRNDKRTQQKKQQTKRQGGRSSAFKQDKSH